ncbi:MAG: PDZ domain-containing protein [Sulfurovaceae bacterium]|nr:PDZ domain-containing protein [Sulfurovaceae bacterium]
MNKIFKLKYLISIIAIIFYIGCGGTHHPSSNDYKTFLYNLFKTQYFWADKVPNSIDLDKYNSPNEMIDNLRYKPKDRWSMVLTKQQNSNFLNQKSGGFGFASVDINSTIVVLFVRINSPADKAGLKRGDIIKKIDNENASINKILSYRTKLDTEIKFDIYRKSTNKNLTIYIKVQDYSFRVSDKKILYTSNGENVGYFRLDSFTATATQEIDKAFDYFKSENIDKLVVDLRYNGGGSVITASILLDKLTRDRDNQLQFKMRWNDTYQNKNRVATFETDENSIDLKQIIFLTTQNTASASELVINAMRPYLGNNIVIIGDRTHGKPVGMEGKTDGVYIYYLINFVIENHNGFYDYFNGLPVTSGCKTPDDIAHQLGDPKEEMLKKALFYIDNGHC